MPEIPGMEDPSLRQVELAEGGTPAGKKTEKITRVGKPVYETSEGEMVSEQSRTLKLGNLYYNVPSIHDGKKYTDEQLVELLDKNLISPTSVHSSLEEALDESKFRSSTLFDTEEDYGQQLSAREGSFADGGVVQREMYGDGSTHLGNGIFEVTLSDGSKTYYGKVMREGKTYKTIRNRDINFVKRQLDDFKKLPKGKNIIEQQQSLESKLKDPKFKKTLNDLDKEIKKIEEKGYFNIARVRDKYAKGYTYGQVNEIKKRIQDLSAKVHTVRPEMEQAMDEYRQKTKKGPLKRGEFINLVKKHKISHASNLNRALNIVDLYKTIPLDSDVLKSNKAKILSKLQEEFTNLGYEKTTGKYRIQGTNNVNLSHLDDKYTQYVTANNLGYATDKINLDLLKPFDEAMHKIYLERAYLLKKKPPGFEAKVEKLNQMGIDLSAKSQGYKTFSIERPDGTKYLYGSEPVKTIDPGGWIEEGKKLKDYTKFDKELINLNKGAAFAYNQLPDDKVVSELTKQSNELQDLLNKFNSEEKKAFSNFGTKLSSFGGGVDPDTIKQAIETLPAKQRNLIFGAASKLRGASNLGLAAAAELTTGSTPLGVAITALLSAPILIDKLGEGYSLGQSLQDVGSMLTFDTIKELDVDRSMAEKYGGPTAAEGYDIKILAEKMADIQNKLLQLDEEQNQFESDPQYAKLVGKEELFRIQRRRKVLSDELANMEKQYQAIPDKFEKFTAFKDIEKYPELEKNIRKSDDALYEPFSTDETVMGFDDPRDEERAEQNIKAKKLLKQFEYKKPKQTLQPLGFLGGVNTYKAIPTEELMNQYLAYGGRVGLEKGGDPKDKPILPINPMIGGEDPRGSLQDPGRRDVLKGMGLLGAGVAAGKLGLLKLGKAIKKAPLTNIVKPMGKTMTQFPKWFPTLINRIRKEGTQIPIFKTKDVNISKQEYDALKQQGTKNLFDRYIGRTENYVNELKQQGIPRYYQKVNTDEIIGYKYEVKDLPDVRVTELEGKEIKINFPNAYGKEVTMTYKAPKVSVDMQGKQVKYDADFKVDDAVPESWSGYEGDIPDFYAETVNNLDEVYGGASKIEQYALNLKKPRTTQGDEVVNAWDAGQPHMSVKEIRDLELKKQKKQERRNYAKEQADETPATFEDREFLKNFLDAGDDID